MDNKSIWTRDFIVISLINLTTFWGFNMTTVGMPVYVAQLGATDLVAGLVTTFVTIAALFIRPFTGVMLDRYGRKSILLISIGLMAAVIISYAVFPILGVILTLRLLHGIGWGLGSTATSTIVADIIPKNRFAEGMGYFALTSALASAAAPALSIALIQNGGVRSMILIATVSTVLSFILAILPTSHHIPKTAKNGNLHLSDFFDKGAILPAGIMFLMSCAFASVITFIVLHGQEQGVDNIYQYFTVYAVVTIISRPAIGKLIDRIGFFIPGILSTLSVVITLVLLSFATNINMFCIAGIFAGLGMGTGMGTLQTMAVASVPAERRGVATSTFLFGLDAGIAIGATIAGALADSVGYANMYLVFAILPMSACFIFIIIGKNKMSSYSDK